ncbi:MAG: type II toxin-antitoxin system HicA family toxin [Candidatus Margulisiibacteriota bacterium]
MTKQLPSLTPKEVIKALRKLGFEFYRQKGSHQIFVKGLYQVVVPYHNKDLKVGTIRNIIKGTGFSIEEFKKVL